MDKRYHLLHTIRYYEPVGRRALAQTLSLREREIRTEIETLTEMALIESTPKGVVLTKTGREIVEDFMPYFEEIKDFRVLEKEIKKTFGLEHVIITPGDSDQDPWVKEELGKRAMTFLLDQLTGKQTVALTGGSTMSAIVKSTEPSTKGTSTLFVPARGGLGERVENQANTICSELANRVNGDYRLLYVPDPLSEESYHSIIEEPGIKETLHIIRAADIVMHGIGDALTMAKRRKTSASVLEVLESGKAVSEAFGYYFDQDGHVVHKVRTVGMQLEDLSKISTVIAVSGGTSKAKAIASYFRQGKSNVLITDEGAAKKLIKSF